jgi:ADP-ribosylglycohydrolase
MIGSIIGDIAGAPYEGDKLGQDKRDYRPFFLNGLAKFTDDTNLTIAVADAILNGKSFAEKYLEWYKKNPNLGYGSGFREWAEKGGLDVGESWANGAAMRVSSIPLLASRLPLPFDGQMGWALTKAMESTVPTHNCSEARNGAMSLVMAGLMAGRREDGKRVYDKTAIKDMVVKLAGYDVTADVETVHNTWDKREIRCDVTVPQALICFLESEDFEDCIRLSVYSKGDVDTIAAMAGGIAEQYYGVESINPGILAETKMRLQPEMIDIVNRCYNNELKW